MRLTTFNFQLLTFNSSLPAAIRQQATLQWQQCRLFLPEKNSVTAAAEDGGL